MLLCVGGLQHGGMTPAGLHHGDSQHVDLGLSAGGMTPAGLHHGGQYIVTQYIVTLHLDMLTSHKIYSLDELHL